MTVYYEWDIEEVDDQGDVIDHFPCNSYKQALRVRTDMLENCIEGVTYDVVLVRNSDKERSWAYIKDGQFEDTHFIDGSDSQVAKIPKRFLNEVAEASK